MKHILITGGSRGLGKATAKKLIAADFKVTILAQEEERAAAAAKELGCDYATADISDVAQVKQAFDKATKANGPIDILINNAGLWIQDKLETNDPQGIKRVLEVNALGTMYCTQAVIPEMKQRENGRIINVISQAGLYGKAERGAYNASKWAVTGFTKSMQYELGPHNISVTGLYPGAISKTDLFKSAGLERVIKNGLEPAMIADAIVYICKLPDGINVPEFGLESLAYGK
jgi:uncharacterized protein